MPALTGIPCLVKALYIAACVCMSSYSLPLAMSSNTCHFHLDELLDELHDSASLLAKVNVLNWYRLSS
jgi:hypothetical protein